MMVEKSPPPRKSTVLPVKSCFALVVLLHFFLYVNFMTDEQHERQRPAETRALKGAGQQSTYPKSSKSQHGEEEIVAPHDVVPSVEKESLEEWPPVQQINNILENSFQGKRLVVAAANADFCDFADNFAQSLAMNNVNNFVLVPLDGEAERVLKQAYPLNTVPLMPGLKREATHVKGFRSQEFKDLTASRPIFLRAFVGKGWEVYYNDIDMYWKQNAFDVIDKLNSKEESNIMLWHDGGPLCSCMLYLRPTPQSIQLLEQWEREIKDNDHTNDQVALNVVTKEWGWEADKENEQGVRVFKNSDEFPHGIRYFGKPDQEVFEEQIQARTKAVVVHNNWIIGKDKKRARFEEFGIWNPSGKVDVDAIASQ